MLFVLMVLLTSVRLVDYITVMSLRYFNTLKSKLISLHTILIELFHSPAQDQFPV